MEEEPFKMRPRQFLSKARPSPVVPPDIRQRLPPGIQMVKRPAAEPSPMKRPRLHPPAPVATPVPKKKKSKPGEQQQQYYSGMDGSGDHSR